VVAALANPTAGWLTLAAASTLAGNLTLLGSVANLIVAESAARRQVHLEFWEYTKAGALITVISLVIGVAWLGWMVW
jgi:Na+/H+ antiporter NhaD/arsenite permease-like protein